MRITGGRLKGRRLVALQGLSIRPTTDQVRETIFNLIGQDLAGLAVLDLFAGTGALGLEALSRGAALLVAIDRAPRAIALMRRNLAIAVPSAEARLIQADLRKGLPHHQALGQCFDLIFADPPYGQDLIPPLLAPLAAILAEGGRIVAETAKTEQIEIPAGPLTALDARIYGDTKLTILGVRDEDERTHCHLPGEF